MSDRTNDKNLSDSGWEVCPPGEIGQLGKRLRRRRDRRFLLRSTAAMAASVLLAGSGAGIYLAGWRDPEPERLGGITCAEFQNMAPDFLKGRLDAAKSQRCQQHLSRCPLCKPFYEKLKTEIG